MGDYRLVNLNEFNVRMNVVGRDTMLVVIVFGVAKPDREETHAQSIDERMFKEVSVVNHLLLSIRRRRAKCNFGKETFGDKL